MSIRNMRFIDAELILATSDLTKFVRCGHATYLDHGTKRGTVTPLAHCLPAAMTNLIAEQATSMSTPISNDSARPAKTS